jgi:hypothetical protein
VTSPRSVQFAALNKIIDGGSPPRLQQMDIGKLKIETIRITRVSEKIAHDLKGLPSEQGASI